MKNTNGRVLLFLSWFAGTGSFNELPNFTFLVFLPRKFISLSKTKIQRTDQNLWRLITSHPVQKLFGVRQEFLKTNFTNALSFVSNLWKFHDFKLWLFDMIFIKALRGLLICAIKLQHPSFHGRVINFSWIMDGKATVTFNLYSIFLRKKKIII